MINIDDTVENSDWIKTRTWDLPKTLKGFLTIVPIDKWEHFQTLPAFKAMPEHLKHEMQTYVTTKKHFGDR